ncbi:unnamed protein product [Caenorhabditis brenneri]
MLEHVSNTPPVEELHSKTPKRAPKAPKGIRVTRATNQDMEYEEAQASPVPPFGMNLLGMMSPLLGGSNALQTFLMAPQTQNDTQLVNAEENQDGRRFIYNSLQVLKNSGKTRVGIIFNPENVEKTCDPCRSRVPSYGSSKKIDSQVEQRRLL